MKKEVRYDSNRVRLRTGEYERPDGKYEYRYSVFGKSFSVYDKTLDGLREKEQQIFSEKKDINTEFNKRTTTLNDICVMERTKERNTSKHIP